MSDISKIDVFDLSVGNSVWGGLCKLYLEHKTFDVTLLARNGEISAHKVVLASVSAYFKLLLTSDLASKNVYTVDLTFCELKILKLVLNFIYTGEISLNQKNILSLVEVQDYLGIGILHHHLSYYMLTTIQDNNCWYYHEVAERHGYKDVFAKVDRYIRTNFSKLITGRKTEFLNLSGYQLFLFFNSDFLGISDHERFLISLCEWIGYCPKERLIHLESLLSNVDIGRIPSWRGMVEKLSGCFPPEYQTQIIEWAERIGEERALIERKLQFKETLLEVILLIGGIINGEVVASTDAFIPPMVLFRVLPKSVDSRQLVIIPPMFYKRFKPTAVASSNAVYVIGGTQNHEELKAKGIPCEVYRLTDNTWHLLPNLPQNKTIRISRNRRPPAAFVEGNLYAALPSPVPSFWMLTRRETCWTRLPSPKSYEIFDLVGVNGAVYCLGRQSEDSTEYLLERYDAFCEFWIRVSSFSLDAPDPEVKGLSLENMLCIGSCKMWLRFDPSKYYWDKMNLGLSENESLPSLCTYKDKQVISLKDVPSLEVTSASGTSEFYLPVRSSAALISILVPVYRPEPI